MRKLSIQELNRISVEEYKNREKIPVVLVLDNIRSLHNVGSMFRTADAFRIEAIFLCGITATPPHREIHRTALGATESVSWKYFPSALEAVQNLKGMDYTVVSVEQTDESIPLSSCDTLRGHKVVLVFGNEINGVSEEVLAVSDMAIEIPQYGTKHSLNVSVSAGIILWELCAGGYEK